MIKRITTAAALACAALAAPLTLAAQEQPAPPAAPSAEALKREIQDIKAQLEPLRQQALQNEELRKEQEELNAALHMALVAADPANEQRLSRLQAIKTEVGEAQAANNTEKVSALSAEEQTLRGELEGAKASVLEQAELSARVTAFKSKLNEATIAVDPKARQLLDRSQELEEQIKKGGGGGGMK